MLVKELASNLAHLMGQESVDNLDPHVREDIRDCVNAAWGELYDRAGRGLTHVPGGSVLRGPEVLTLTLTIGSAAFTPAVNPAWVGQTVLIPGEPVPNEFTSTNTLRYPVTQASGAVQARAIGSSVDLGANAVALAGRPTVNGRLPGLLPLASRQEYDAVLGYGREAYPEAYFVEGIDGRLWLRVAPLVRQNSLIHYEIERCPPEYDVEDLALTADIPLPGNLAQEVLLPFARSRAGSLRNFPAEAARGIEADYRKAVARIERWAADRAPKGSARNIFGTPPRGRR